ncbi:MAG: hypothetical protein MUE85_17170 [Microscillaceae bacterium]|jgi:hypothetical protein|nr:hypothetical protein [Microscillaceae bacterium]
MKTALVLAFFILSEINAFAQTAKDFLIRALRQSAWFPTKPSLLARFQTRLARVSANHISS